MKKVMILSVALLVAIVMAAPAVADVSWGNGVVTLGSGSAGDRPAATYGLSSSVYLYYDADADHMNYAIGTVHKAGNRGFGSANSTTLIYYQSKNTGDTSVGSLPTPATDASFASGTWTAL